MVGGVNLRACGGERESNDEHEILEMMRANMAPPLENVEGPKQMDGIQ